MRFRTRMMALTLLMAWAPQFAAADDQASMRERLMKQGPPAWDVWKEYLGKFEAKATVIDQGLGKTAELKPLTTEKYRVRSNAPCSQMIRFLESGAVREIVYSTNNNYSFMLFRSNDHSPYVIKYIESSTQEISESLEVHVLEHIHSPWMFWGTPLSKFFADPNLTFKEITSVSEDGEDLVRVSFNLKWDGSLNTGAFQSGWFLLSPQNRWAVKRYEIRTGLPSTGLGTYAVAVEFGDEDAGFRKPKKVTRRAGGDRDGHVVETVCLLENWEHKTIDPAQFRLSAFGLPETIVAEDQPATPASLASGIDFGTWPLMLGALAAIVAVALRIWSYRAAASKVRTEP